MAGCRRTVRRRYAASVDRAICAYHLDDQGDWVAELSCGHAQHVRHRPPFQLREWVLEPEGRTEHLGTSLNCPRCDNAEMPNDARLVRSSAQWDEHTMPAGLRRSHRLATRTWGRVVVRSGRLRFTAHSVPELDLVLGPGATQAILPDVPHEVEPLGQVSFSIDFFPPRRPETAHATADEESQPESGGESACFAHLLCAECGAVLDGGAHAP